MSYTTSSALRTPEKRLGDALRARSGATNCQAIGFAQLVRAHRMRCQKKHEVSEEDRRYQNGRDPNLLDILAIPCLSHQPLPHQHENHLIDPAFYWERQGALAWSEIGGWLDSPPSLWGSGQSSYAFVNNRVPDRYQDGTSLQLISVDSLLIIVGPKSEQNHRVIKPQNQTEPQGQALTFDRSWQAEPQGQALTFDRSWQESRPDP